MTLKLNNLDVYCIIGDEPDERTTPQHLTIDVALEIGDRAGETDVLADTVDYAALTAEIRRALETAACRMIERAARIVADICQARQGVKAGRVTVTKAGRIEGLGSASVEYCWPHLDGED